MKALVISSLILVFGVTSCNSKRLAQDEKILVQPAAAQSCYLHVSDKDTVKVTITYDQQSVRGALTYNLYEKDGSIGDFQGRMIGDTILAQYTFQSEGVKSVREVAFLKKNATLVEGFAPMDESGTHFANRAELDFAGIVLTEVDCYEQKH
jgi:hypothetical protein